MVTLSRATFTPIPPAPLLPSPTPPAPPVMVPDTSRCPASRIRPEPQLLPLPPLQVSPELPHAPPLRLPVTDSRSEEHTSELQSLLRTPYDVFCMKKQTHKIAHP